MLIDKRSTFARETALPSSAGTAKFGEALPLDVAGVDQGVGEPLYLVVSMFAAAAGGTSAAFELVTASNEALTADVVVLQRSAVVPTAQLGAGKNVFVSVIARGRYDEWLGLRAVTVGTFTGGSVNAFLTWDPPSWMPLPDNNK